MRYTSFLLILFILVFTLGNEGCNEDTVDRVVDIIEEELDKDESGESGSDGEGSGTKPTPEPTAVQTPTPEPSPEPTPEPTPVETPEPTVTPIKQAKCIPLADGADKPNLFKPRADTNVGAVLLMDNSYCDKKTGKPIGLNTSHNNDKVIRKHCNGANGNRAHWFLDHQGADYEKNLKITFDGRPECFIIANPAVRND